MSFSHVVVGIDFSAHAQLAVEHAMEIARHTGARLTLVHVAPVLPPLTARADDTWSAFLDEQLAGCRARLQVLRERLSGQGVDVSQAFIEGFPHTGLADAARALGADLIVVGTHGRTGLSRILLGSVAERTIREADRSVLVVRGPAHPGGYHRVVVGSDYDPAATLALARAIELTAPRGDVHVVHAWRPPYTDFGFDVPAIASLREAAELEAKPQRAMVLGLPRPPDVAIRLDVVDGPPFVVLDDLSASADLIVVGSHSRQGVRRFLLGSTAEATTRHARCSVLVARGSLAPVTAAPEIDAPFSQYHRR